MCQSNTAYRVCDFYCLNERNVSLVAIGAVILTMQRTPAVKRQLALTIRHKKIRIAREAYFDNKIIP